LRTSSSRLKLFSAIVVLLIVVSLQGFRRLREPTMVFLHPGPLQDLRMKVKLWTAFFPCVILPVGASD
jgi:hypothetical protein